VGDDHDEGKYVVILPIFLSWILSFVFNETFFNIANVGDEDAGEAVPRNTAHHGQSALSLFPSSLCSAIVQIINLLDDPAVSDDGNAVYEVAYQVLRKLVCYDSIVCYILSFNVVNPFCLTGDLELSRRG
jgi:hypothetical protein